jgi:hypothetical protein
VAGPPCRDHTAGVSPGTLEETARWVGAARWLELRCFELLGGWVTTTPEPDVKLAFARQSHHHAWHAELFERVLPSANGFSADGLVAAPDDSWSAFLDDLAALTVTGDRLVGAYELLMPGKLDEYEHWHSAVDPVQDAPLRRWLGFVVMDEHADLAEGRALLVDRGATAAAPHREALVATHHRAGRLLR